ncbi:protein JINGUBANG-like [Impatiens glandulifera]|uniref:protein JINGUBANG-like n=1 Tax=Impatiens glandulifera TaxID=253017 RepID=UPI001FB113C9|nr:protein JINGUBANG-like [Impatiens glandulifera]
MKLLRRWLSTCSSATSIAVTETSPAGDDVFSGSCLHSDYSLQTLPSIPSLQNLSAIETSLDISVNRLSLSSLKLILPFPIGALAVNNNLLYAAAGHLINVYNLDNYNFTLIDTFNHNNPNSGSIKSIVFQTSKIFTAHQDGKIRVWKMVKEKKHNLLATLPTLQDRLLRSILPRNYVTIRRHKKKLWIEHHDAVSSLAQVEGGDDNIGNLIISTSWDKSFKIWNLSSSDGQYRCLQSIIDAHDDALNAVAVSPDGTFFTASADCRIRVWGRIPGDRNRKYSLLATLEKHKSAVNCLALNDDGSILFSGACDRSILVWEREDSANYMAVKGALRGHSRAILCLINISDLLISGSADRTVRIWRRGYDDGRYSCLIVLDGHMKPVRSVAATVVNGGGSGGAAVRVFSGSFDGEIKAHQISMLRPTVCKSGLGFDGNDSDKSCENLNPESDKFKSINFVTGSLTENRTNPSCKTGKQLERAKRHLDSRLLGHSI